MVTELFVRFHNVNLTFESHYKYVCAKHARWTYSRRLDQLPLDCIQKVALTTQHA